MVHEEKRGLMGRRSACAAAVLLMFLASMSALAPHVLGLEPDAYRWSSTLGPPGGLGYDTRIDPRNTDIVFTTDQWAGMCKSYDGGYTWFPRNEGIDSRFGPSLDSIPIFCCTIDPYDSDIVWCGTYGMKGVFKSYDAGETWNRMDNGIPDLGGMSFRSFTIDPTDTDIVYTGVEVPVEGQNKSRGMIFKTIDGGENWFAVLECDALVRHIVIDPTDTDIVYTATGIFDRPDVQPEGILKSEDGGMTWIHINEGITNLVVGGLSMHPDDAEILYCSTGKHDGFGPSSDPEGARHGSILMTVNGGATWTTISPEYRAWNAVEVDRSDPSIVYASCEHFFTRSYDGGESWDTVRLGVHGVYSGTPISITIDPTDPDKVFVNSYTGGLYLSLDAGSSWINAMNGFTGSEITDVAVDRENPSVVFAVGRSGPFKSLDGGLHWQGTGAMLSRPQPRPEWSAVAFKPDDPSVVMAADQFFGELYRSDDRGESWSILLTIFPSDQVLYPYSLHGIKTIAFAPSDTSIIYVGARIPDKTIEFERETPFDTTLPSMGIYRSTDDGETWAQINEGLADTTKNINEIVVHPTNPDIAYAGTLNSGIYKTVDGGRHWIAINDGLARSDIRALAMDPGNPEVIYAGAEGAGVFKSEDGGLAWRQINVGLDAEATIRGIVVDPSNSNRIYVGDWHTGVYVSENAGEVFRHVNQGLENRAVTAIDISADGSVLYAATQGGGVFRLGVVATTATVFGRVTDAVTGEPVAGAVASIGTTGFSASSDENGLFEIESLPTGTSTLSVSAQTYSTFRERGIILTGGETREIEIELCRRLYPALVPSVNGDVFGVGDIISLDAALEHRGPSVRLDLYIAISSPGGLFFFNGESFNADITSFPMFIMTGTELSFNIAEFGVTSDLPAGEYIVYGAAVIPGGFDLYSVIRSVSFEIVNSDYYCVVLEQTK
ncbi:carboxypeptidase regulatory-like domain-containing protein [bacterium]|nr:carboxypeptidase regulatory-like domain-containing protein [bacterium]